MYSFSQGDKQKRKSIFKIIIFFEIQIWRANFQNGGNFQMSSAIHDIQFWFDRTPALYAGN